MIRIAIIDDNSVWSYGEPYLEGIKIKLSSFGEEIEFWVPEVNNNTTLQKIVDELNSKEWDAIILDEHLGLDLKGEEVFENLNDELKSKVLGASSGAQQEYLPQEQRTGYITPIKMGDRVKVLIQKNNENGENSSPN